MSKLEKMKIVSDAACSIPNAHIKGRESKGESACGIIFLDEKNSTIKEYPIYLGVMTNQQAEYNGLIKALELAPKFCSTDIEVWMDSEFVIKQMNGEYAVKSPSIKPLHEKVKELAKRFGKIRYFHHSENSPLGQRADRLAKNVLNTKQNQISEG